MRTPISLWVAVSLLPTTVFAQVPATPAKPAPPAVVVPAAPAKQAVPRPVNPGAPYKLGVTGPLGFKGLTQPEPKVDLDLENATVREALKQIFAQAHQDYEVDESVPDEPRVTAHVKNVRLSTALQLVLQEAGSGMHLSLKDGKSTMRIFKYGAKGAESLYGLPDILNFRVPLRADGTLQLPDQLPDHLKKLLGQTGIDLKAAVPYVLNLQEQRSTFRCPHCKGQSTVIRKADQPKCEKCGRQFLPDWQFCPADGTKRPTAASEWQYCPFCGKRVPDGKNAEIPFLSELPVVGRLFRNAPAPGDVLVEPAP